MIYNIAIDGPAGAGKSTIAKKLAKDLGFVYVDTGAMYRATALYAFRMNANGIVEPMNGSNSSNIVEMLKDIHIGFIQTPEGQHVTLNGEDVESQIRTLEIGNLASQISTIKEVRAFLVAQQQAMGKKKGIVMDGRDIGTTVFPNAELKIFQIASVEERALFSDILVDVASQIFIPLTVGGGINTLDDFDRVLKCGADKVSVNSGAIRNPDIIEQAAKKYGDQCVVISADVKRVDGVFRVFAKGGRENTGLDAIEWIKQGEKNGAGEIVVNSIDTDGVTQNMGVIFGLYKSAKRGNSNSARVLAELVGELKQQQTNVTVTTNVNPFANLTEDELRKLAKDE